MLDPAGQLVDAMAAQRGPNVMLSLPWGGVVEGNGRAALCSPICFEIQVPKSHLRNVQERFIFSSGSLP